MGNKEALIKICGGLQSIIETLSESHHQLEVYKKQVCEGKKAPKSKTAKKLLTKMLQKILMLHNDLWESVYDLSNSEVLLKQAVFIEITLIHNGINQALAELEVLRGDGCQRYKFEKASAFKLVGKFCDPDRGEIITSEMESFRVRTTVKRLFTESESFFRKICDRHLVELMRLQMRAEVAMRESSQMTPEMERNFWLYYRRLSGQKWSAITKELAEKIENDKNGWPPLLYSDSIRRVVTDLEKTTPFLPSLPAGKGGRPKK